MKEKTKQLERKHSFIFLFAFLSNDLIHKSDKITSRLLRIWYN